MKKRAGKARLCDCGQPCKTYRNVCERCCWLDFGVSREVYSITGAIIAALRDMEVASTAELADEVGSTVNTVFMALSRLKKCGRVTSRFCEDWGHSNHNTVFRMFGQAEQHHSWTQSRPASVWYLTEG